MRAGSISVQVGGTVRRHRRSTAPRREERPQKSTKINEEIRASHVLLIAADGEQLGKVSRDALERARAAELDLVEVASAADPPVCRIADYGKLRYEQERKQKLARRNQTRIAVKEVRLRPKIGDHDYDWKLDQVRQFLDQNAKVKLAVFFRGREREHPDRGRDILDRIAASVDDRASVELRPTMEGRSMFMVLAPKSGRTSVGEGAEGS